MRFLTIATLALISFAILPVHAAEPVTTLVFFSEWSAAIEPDAETAIQKATDLAKQSSDSKVMVVGYADTTGSDAANKLMSQLRSQVVADKLESDGVPKDHIQQKAEGEVPTVGEKQESRRVSITVE